jgi:hypothetical protein
MKRLNKPLPLGIGLSTLTLLSQLHANAMMIIPNSMFTGSVAAMQSQYHEQALSLAPTDIYPEVTLSGTLDKITQISSNAAISSSYAAVADSYANLASNMASSFESSNNGQSNYSAVTDALPEAVNLAALMASAAGMMAVNTASYEIFVTTDGNQLPFNVQDGDVAFSSQDIIATSAYAKEAVALASDVARLTSNTSSLADYNSTASIAASLFNQKSAAASSNHVVTAKILNAMLDMTKEAIQITEMGFAQAQFSLTSLSVLESSYQVAASIANSDSAYAAKLDAQILAEYTSSVADFTAEMANDAISLSAVGVVGSIAALAQEITSEVQKLSAATNLLSTEAKNTSLASSFSALSKQMSNFASLSSSQTAEMNADLSGAVSAVHVYTADFNEYLLLKSQASSYESAGASSAATSTTSLAESYHNAGGVAKNTIGITDLSLAHSLSQVIAGEQVSLSLFSQSLANLQHSLIAALQSSLTSTQDSIASSSSQLSNAQASEFEKEATISSLRSEIATGLAQRDKVKSTVIPIIPNVKSGERNNSKIYNGNPHQWPKKGETKTLDLVLSGVAMMGAAYILSLKKWKRDKNNTAK